MSRTIACLLTVLSVALLSISVTQAAEDGHDHHDQGKHMDMQHAASPGHDPYTLSVDPLGGSSAVQGAEYVLAGFDSLVNWARKSSMWPMTFGLA